MRLTFAATHIQNVLVVKLFLANTVVVIVYSKVRMLYVGLLRWTNGEMRGFLRMGGDPAMHVAKSLV